MRKQEKVIISVENFTIISIFEQFHLKKNTVIILKSDD